MFKSSSILKKAEYYHSLATTLEKTAAISRDGVAVKALVAKAEQFIQAHSHPGILLDKPQTIERDKLEKDLGQMYGIMTQEEMQIKTYSSGISADVNADLKEIIEIKESIMDCQRKLYELKSAP